MQNMILVLLLNHFFKNNSRPLCNLSYLNTEQSNYYKESKVIDTKVNYFVTRNNDIKSKIALNNTI